MASRLSLHNLLIDILGSNNVYYQPPITMNYPAIRYKKVALDDKFADNIKYVTMERYEIIVIADEPDHEAIGKILSLPYSSYSTGYVKDNLNHDVLYLYY